MQEEQTILGMVDEARAGKLPRRSLIKALAGIGISTVGIGAIIKAASRPPASPASPSATVVNPQDTTSQLQLHDQHITNQSQGRLNELYYDYAEHAVVEDSMYPTPVVGRTAIIARKTLGMFATTNAQINVTNRIALGNQLVVEWVATGIHSGDLPGLPASGRPYTLQGVTVVIRQDGKIVREALYYNVEDFRNQLSES